MLFSYQATNWESSQFPCCRASPLKNTTKAEKANEFTADTGARRPLQNSVFPFFFFFSSLSSPFFSLLQFINSDQYSKVCRTHCQWFSIIKPYWVGIPSDGNSCPSQLGVRNPKALSYQLRSWDNIKYYFFLKDEIPFLNRAKTRQGWSCGRISMQLCVERVYSSLFLHFL